MNKIVFIDDKYDKLDQEYQKLLDDPESTIMQKRILVQYMILYLDNLINKLLDEVHNNIKEGKMKPICQNSKMTNSQ